MVVDIVKEQNYKMDKLGNIIINFSLLRILSRAAIQGFVEKSNILLYVNKNVALFIVWHSY